MDNNLQGPEVFSVNFVWSSCDSPGNSVQGDIENCCTFQAFDALMYPKILNSCRGIFLDLFS